MICTSGLVAVNCEIEFDCVLLDDTSVEYPPADEEVKTRNKTPTRATTMVKTVKRFRFVLLWLSSILFPFSTNGSKSSPDSEANA